MGSWRSCVLLVVVVTAGSAETLTGVVSDITGEPLPAVEVMAASGERRWRATTNGAGWYQVDGVPTGTCAVMAHRAGYGGGRRSFALPSGAAMAGNITLQRLETTPGVVAGRLVRSDERSSAGGRVEVFREVAPFWFTQHVGTAVADEAGWYEVRGLTPGRYRLLPQGARDRHTRPFEGDVVEVGAAAGVSRDLGYPPRRDALRPATVPVQLLTPDGRPAANRCIRAQVRVAGSWPDTGTGWLPFGVDLAEPPRRGSYTAEATGWLRADALGRATVSLPPGLAWLRLGGEAVVPFCLAPGEALPVIQQSGEFPLRETIGPAVRSVGGAPLPPPLRCRVEDGAGRPLGRCRGWLFGGRRDGWLASAAVEGTAAGEIDVPERPPEGTTLALKVAGWAEVTRTCPAAADPGPLLTFHLESPARHVAGRVVAANGEPLAGVWVLAAMASFAGRTPEWGALRYWYDGGPPPDASSAPPPGQLRRGLYYAASDADGRFALDQLDDGEVTLVACRPGGGHSEPRTLATSAQPVTGVVLTLAPPSPPDRIAGRVVGLTGAALPGVYVELRDGHETGGHAVSDADGNFTFDREPVCEPGATPELQFNDRAWLCDSATVLAPQEPGQVPTHRMHRSVRLRGRVAGPDGRPVRRAWVVAEARPKQPSCDAFTDAEGRFELMGLPPGGLALVVSARGLARARVAVADSAQEDLAVRLEPGRQVRGRVVDSAGHPLYLAHLSWQPPLSPRRADSAPHGAGPGWFETVTDEEGRFCLDALPLGPVAVRVSGSPDQAEQTAMVGDEPPVVVMTPRR